MFIFVVEVDKVVEKSIIKETFTTKFFAIFLYFLYLVVKVVKVVKVYQSEFLLCLFCENPVLIL